MPTLHGSSTSGHTSKAFTVAGFIHKSYGWKYSIPACIGAVFVGYSRVKADKHFVEDVVAGAAIGILSSFYGLNQVKTGKLIPGTGLSDQGPFGTSTS